MKKLQLIKHIAGEITKGNKILMDNINDDKIAYTDGFKIWIISKNDNIFNDKIKNADLYSGFTDDILNALKPIENYYILKDEEIKKGQYITVGNFKGENFYFNSSFLKYFDKDCKLYKKDKNPCRPIYILKIKAVI